MIFTLRCVSCDASIRVPASSGKFACARCGNEQWLIREGDAVFLTKASSAVSDPSARAAAELALKRIKPELVSAKNELLATESSLEFDRQAICRLSGEIKRLSDTDANRWLPPPPVFKLHAGYFFSLWKVCLVILIGFGLIKGNLDASLFLIILLVLAHADLLSDYTSHIDKMTEYRKDLAAAPSKKAEAISKIMSDLRHYERDISKKLPIRDQQAARLQNLQARYDSHLRIAES